MCDPSRFIQEMLLDDGTAADGGRSADVAEGSAGEFEGVVAEALRGMDAAWLSSRGFVRGVAVSRRSFVRRKTLRVASASAVLSERSR